MPPSIILLAVGLSLGCLLVLLMRSTHGVELGCLAEVEPSSCCVCPPVPCTEINERTGQVRMAMEKAVPGKWFLVEGTLIAALRWGEHCHQFQSGKKNFVDGDIDVYVIVNPGGEAKAAAAIGEVLAKDGWSEPKDRGDGIYVTSSPLKVPLQSCDKDLSQQQTLQFYVDIHIMVQRPDGNFDVGPMAHLWQAFLQDGVLPYEVIFPLAECEWGGGKAYAPAQYSESLAKWNGGEYGAKTDLWLPLESKLATGDWFHCPCRLSDADKQEVARSERSLHARGMASFTPPARIVVSLTTIPPRLPKLEAVLQALAQQPEVDAVYLNIPHVCEKLNAKYDPLPDFLNRLEKVHVQRCDDYGPLTKLLPTLEVEQDPHTIIIVCDDDHQYGPGWAAGLAQAVDAGKVAAYATWRSDDLDIASGYKGFAFQRQVFAPGYHDYFRKLSRACKFGDDYSISFYLKRRGAQVVALEEPPGMISDLDHYGMPEVSLKHGEALTQGNAANYTQCKSDLAEHGEAFLH